MVLVVVTSTPPPISLRLRIFAVLKLRKEWIGETSREGIQHRRWQADSENFLVFEVRIWDDFP